MEKYEILKLVDHTVLKATTTKKEIEELCNQALECNVASICINPAYIQFAVEKLQNRIPVCTVIGFPLGAMTTESKIFEAKDAISKGAKEIDMVINIGRLKDGDYKYVEDEIRQIKQSIGNNILKVIIETCLLNEEEKIAMCKIVTNAKADFIKTSTGFSTLGATFSDVELFKKYIGENVQIKAAGGIKTKDDMEKFILLGATRLGTSSAIKILNNSQSDGY